MPTAEHYAVYKSSRKEGMYIYVLATRELADVPESLLASFGKPVLVTRLQLTPERRLARCSGADVIEAVAGQGFYLQMPPGPVDYMSHINRYNTKL
jgi:uncharacterized protein